MPQIWEIIPFGMGGIPRSVLRFEWMLIVPEDTESILGRLAGIIAQLCQQVWGRCHECRRGHRLPYEREEMSQGTPWVSDTRNRKGDSLLFPGVFQMDNSESKIISVTPRLGCILTNKNSFDPQTLKREHTIFFCTCAWPGHQLGDGEKRPPEGSVNHNTISQVDLFYSEEGKWSEIPHVQDFFAPRRKPELCQKCQTDPRS